MCYLPALGHPKANDVRLYTLEFPLRRFAQCSPSLRLCVKVDAGSTNCLDLKFEDFKVRLHRWQASTTIFARAYLNQTNAHCICIHKLTNNVCQLASRVRDYSSAADRLSLHSSLSSFSPYVHDEGGISCNRSMCLYFDPARLAIILPPRPPHHLPSWTPFRNNLCYNIQKKFNSCQKPYPKKINRFDDIHVSPWRVSFIRDLSLVLLIA